MVLTFLFVRAVAVFVRSEPHALHLSRYVETYADSYWRMIAIHGVQRSFEKRK